MQATVVLYCLWFPAIIKVIYAQWMVDLHLLQYENLHGVAWTPSENAYCCCESLGCASSLDEIANLDCENECDVEFNIFPDGCQCPGSCCFTSMPLWDSSAIISNFGLFNNLPEVEFRCYFGSSKNTNILQLFFEMEDYDGGGADDDDFTDNISLPILAYEHHSEPFEITGDYGVVRLTLSYTVLNKVSEDKELEAEDYCEISIISLSNSTLQCSTHQLGVSTGGFTFETPTNNSGSTCQNGDVENSTEIYLAFALCLSMFAALLITLSIILGCVLCSIKRKSQKYSLQEKKEPIYDEAKNYCAKSSGNNMPFATTSNPAYNKAYEV